MAWPDNPLFRRVRRGPAGSARRRRPEDIATDEARRRRDFEAQKTVYQSRQARAAAQDRFAYGGKQAAAARPGVDPSVDADGAAALPADEAVQRHAVRLDGDAAGDVGELVGELLVAGGRPLEVEPDGPVDHAAEGLGAPQRDGRVQFAAAQVVARDLGLDVRPQRRDRTPDF